MRRVIIEKRLRKKRDDSQPNILDQQLTKIQTNFLVNYGVYTIMNTTYLNE